MITVNRINATTYEVIVADRITTTHRVIIPSAYYKKLTNERVPPEVLLERSFHFLLERESNTSILTEFELDVIAKYFPEYEHTIITMLEE